MYLIPKIGALQVQLYNSNFVNSEELEMAFSHECTRNGWWFVTKKREPSIATTAPRVSFLLPEMLQFQMLLNKC
eukprot:1655872-Amphidinium_carterae.1